LRNIKLIKNNSLILGDCLKEMMDNIEPHSIDMILTDLPYGMTARNKWDIVLPFNKLWFLLNHVSKENTAKVFTAIEPFNSMLIMSNKDDFKYSMIWEKQQGTGFLNAKKQPLRNHEHIIVFYKKQCVYNPQFTEGKPYKQLSGRGSFNYNEQKRVITINKGLRYPLTIVFFPYDKEKLHPTQKPISLFEYLIRTYSNENDLVLDCCAGSGTTAIACINTNRNYICIEKDKKIFQIMKNRVEKHLKGEDY